MKTYLEGEDLKTNEPKGIEKLRKTEDKEKCKRCAFKEVCLG